MNLTEGCKVLYVGDGKEGLLPGDLGKVLALDGSAAHVSWRTGAAKGRILFIDSFDLVVESAATRYDDDLESPLVSVAVREVWERQGNQGLLDALGEEGHLATFMPVVEEAFSIVASKVRQDPSFREVMAHLDDDEWESFVSYTTSALLRDAEGDFYE